MGLVCPDFRSGSEFFLLRVPFPQSWAQWLAWLFRKVVSGQSMPFIIQFLLDF
jgi:hypothetical protein